MTAEERTQILNLLDAERQTVVYPGITRSSNAGVIKDVSADGESAEIVYSALSPDEADAAIRRELQTARNAGQELEWKLYGHDQPADLAERLVAAGFTADVRESFMVFPADVASVRRFGNLNPSRHIRQIYDRDGLRDYQTITEEVYGRSFERQIEQFAFMLENHPASLSIYVAYVGDEPAACGRVYFHSSSRFAGLFGGSTRERFRRRGLFTQIVAARLHEAVRRGVAYVCVDALPSSEPILAKRGFEAVTYTQPFLSVG